VSFAYLATHATKGLIATEEHGGARKGKGKAKDTRADWFFTQK